MIICVIVLGLPSSASAISAYPFKDPSDSGVVSQADFLSAMSGGSPEGWDACVISDIFETVVQSFQQYGVSGCVPVQSPYIELKALGTRGWAIYCPDGAPNSWVSSGGGALQGWSDTAGSWAMDEIQGDNSYGPSPVAKSDYFMTNWTFKTVYFEFLVGCSPEPWTSNSGLAPYCCGQGTSAQPTWTPPPSSGKVAGSVRAKPLRGPAHRRTDLSPDRYAETREVDLGPNVRQTRTMRCSKGFVSSHGHWGVGWYTDGFPRRNDGRVHESPHKIARGFRITVTANRRVKRRSARLQASISCRRRGTLRPPAQRALPPYFGPSA